MITIDIGNTNIVIGFYNNKTLLFSKRFETKKFIYNKKIVKFFINSIKKYKIHKYKNLIIFSSVVNKKDEIIKKVSNKINWKCIDIKSKKFKKFYNLKHVSFDQLGADRIANYISSKTIYGKNIIIVDFGTATTFDIIKNGEYLGGIISPGINVSNQALSDSAFNLKKIKIVKINKIIGNNTIKAMQSGFYWGYLSLIKGILDEIIKQNKFFPKIIFTGGLSTTYKEIKKYKIIFDENLTLKGLYLIGSLYV